MTDDKFKQKVSNMLYSAILPIVEKLETNGEIFGNGHHITQEIIEEITTKLLARKVK
tara:strand:+ start:1903 stop:2073 length:171 start_codon:yes stop_codon:yes gene_type:complete